MLHWIGQNWFDLLQTITIVASLIFTSLSFRMDIKSRRISNLINLTGSHRDIWSQIYRRPEMTRVLDPKAELAKHAVTEAERVFVTLIVLHLSSVYHALEEGLTVPADGLGKDVHDLFSLPIPSAVWTNIRSLQDHGFVQFVESCLKQSKNSDHK